MAQMKTKEIKEMNAYFLPEGFAIDEVYDESADTLKTWENAFDKNKYEALFHLGFLNKESWFSPSIEFLHHIAENLIKKLSQQSEIELFRDKVHVELTEDELYQLKEQIPFAIGMEYVDDDWIVKVWESLLAVFRLEIKTYDGTVAKYFTDYNSNINIVGRIFFHLVENKSIEYPFAFMATYSTKAVKSNRATHIPLKNALSEFKGDERKLISLIATVVKAAEKSSFISELLESGELFAKLPSLKLLFCR